MSLCCGIDFSTKAVHVAAIPLDPDIKGGPWKTAKRVGKDRHASVHYLVREALRDLADQANMDVATVCVEQPVGKVHRSMHELHGVIRAATPPSIPSTSLSPSEWRKAIGVTTIGKAAGLEQVRNLYPDCSDWDEHELDALGICTAWRSIQWKETA